jgi:hypothetical protein
VPSSFSGGPMSVPSLGSALLELLESSPGSLGGGCVGKGCWVAASEGVVDGAGESGGGAGLVCPGKGNCSAVDGFFAGGVDGGQGLVVWSCVWFGVGQGVAGGFWAGADWTGADWAKLAVESRSAAMSARVVE